MPLAPGGAPTPHPAPAPSARWAVTTAAQLVALAALIGAVALGHGAVARHANAVLVAGLLAGGPHGALDHLVAGRLAGRPGGAGARFAVTYALAAVGTLAALLATGPVGLGALVALAVWHFASGETEVVSARAGRRADELDRAIGWATGVAMVAVPIASHPAAALAVADRVVGRRIPVPAGATLHAVAASCVVGIACVAAVAAARRCALEAVELSALTVTALLCPPAAAFGVSFAAGHSLRHVTRLVTSGVVEVPAPGRSSALARSAVTAAWPLSTVIVVGVAAVGSGVATWPTALLGGLLALTVPHAAVVASLDHRRPLPPLRRDPAAGQPAAQVRTTALGAGVASGAGAVAASPTARSAAGTGIPSR